MRITDAKVIVKRSEAGIVIDLEYTGELDDSTKIQRKLYGIQDRLLAAANRKQALIDMIKRDFRAEADRIKREKARQTALENIANEVEAFKLDSPIDITTAESESAEELEVTEESS